MITSLHLSQATAVEASFRRNTPNCNGVFTKYLIQALRGNNSCDVKSAFADLQENVAWEVQNAFGEKRTPQLGGEWEGKELILSVPSSEPRSVLNPELLREIRLASPSLQESHVRGAVASSSRSQNVSIPQRNGRK